MDSQSGALFKCPISGVPVNGKHPFVCLRRCGCVVLRRALRNVDSAKCVVCAEAMDAKNGDSDYARIPIHGDAAKKEALFKAMMARNAKSTERKRKRQRRK